MSDLPSPAARVPAAVPPRVVTLCGSMSFEQSMRAAAVTESLSGAIVLLPLVNMKRPDARWTDPADATRIKADLDRLHLAKIDAADEVLVICPGGYIGQSTRREIDYARRAGKPVRFWPHRVPCGFGCGYLADDDTDLAHHEETDCENRFAPEEPCGYGCGYYDRGAGLLARERDEHTTCAECGAEPNDDGIVNYGVSHRPGCPRLTGASPHPAGPADVPAPRPVGSLPHRTHRPHQPTGGDPR